MNAMFQNLMITLLGLIMIVVAIEPLAFGSKKKLTGADADAQKDMQPIQKVLEPLAAKTHGRALFNADDLSNVQQVHDDLLEMMDSYPKSQVLTRPIYDAAQVFESRDMLDEATEFYTYIQTNYPNSPYASLSKTELDKLKKKMAASGK